jgi:hypothetical protein
MTRHAAHAITRQSSIHIRLLVIVVSRVNQLRIEISPAMIVIETTLTHHAMTSEARVVDGLDVFRDLRRIVFEETLDESNLTLELCVKDRIASGQSHRRPAPLTIRRNVHHRR